MRAEKCPFCGVSADRIVARTGNVIAVRDAFPVSNGHTLLFSRQHVNSIFDLPDEDYIALWVMLARLQIEMKREYSPQGFNIGVNDGEAAGQTVPHAHVHLIPRYKGDVPDPRGGIRWILPEKAKYWK